MNVIKRLKRIFGVREGYMDMNELMTRMAIKRLFADDK